ncbi:hypothetical protein [Streptomyces gilvosporeus]|uniref:Uncharacterized protein n=1 Tax=Streptomyces gilvosporeus TaxID=553510 RepID=A0A1V0TKX5_9ACTN|nr:hypothetical protein [Streptomyces gilvosporeus]ARF53584.1 hypothetical protein B1H19_04805 [Streptomyces gilvosporeus]
MTTTRTCEACGTQLSARDGRAGRLRAVGRTGNGELWAVGGKGAAPVALRWDAQHGRWARAADPGVVVRGLATVPKSEELWIAGIARHGDLRPVITRMAS